MNRRVLLILGLIGAGAFLYYKYSSGNLPVKPRKTTILKKVKNKMTEIIQYAKSFSQNALDLIQHLEGGFQSKAYPDAGGWSIGFGHYMGKTITENNITLARALQLLASDAIKAKGIMDKYVKVPLNQNQYDAILSAVYNLGTALFWNDKKKTYTKFYLKLNAGDFAGAMIEFKDFNHSQGKVNTALTERRATETALFLA